MLRDCIDRDDVEPADSARPRTCSYPDWTAADLLKRSAARFPNVTALLFYGTRISYAQLHAMATAFAAALHHLGLRPGDRVAIMLPNTPQAVIAHYGVLQAGGIVVQTNPLYLPQELEIQLRDCEAHIIVTLDLFYPRIEQILPRTALKHIIVARIQDFLPLVKRLLYPLKARLQKKWTSVPSSPPVLDFRQLLKSHEHARVSGDAPSPDDLALLQYTGGTTGTPKGVMLSHRNVVANAIQCRAWMPKCREGKEVFLGVIPFFHVYGLSTCQHLAILTGSTLVLLPRFEVTEVLHALHKTRVTVMSAIPMMFLKIIDFPNIHHYDLRSLRICLSGASPLHRELQDRFERLTGVKITQGYGLTEAGPVTHCNPIGGKAPRGSIGVPFPDTEARVVDVENGERLLAPWQAGELVVRGPQVMRGYWRNDGETRSVLRDGWLYTGDIVRQDERGFFFLLDRKKDMIKTRGENVYPREVEEVLFRHPAVKEAVVAGIPDRQLGEAVMAYVVVQPGQRVTERELILHCRQHLACFKAPTGIRFRTELPKTLVGKVLRRALQQEEEQHRSTRNAGLDNDREAP